MKAELLGSVKSFRPEQIAVVMTTYYPNWYPGPVGRSNLVDKIRGDLAIQTFAAAKRKGYQLVVVDGGSSEGFLVEVNNRKIGVIPEREREE